MVIIFSVLYRYIMQGKRHQWYEGLTVDQQICNLQVGHYAE